MARRSVQSGSSLALVWARLPLVVRYGVAGAVTQVIYLSVLGFSLHTGLHYVLAIAAAQVVAICYAFPVYRNRVFSAEGPFTRQVTAFLGVWGTGALMSFIGVPLLVELVGLPPFAAQLVVLVAVFTFSFLAHRGLTFARRGVATPGPAGSTLPAGG